MTRLFKTIYLSLAFLLVGCEKKSELKPFYVVYECLYSQASVVLEKEHKPYSETLLRKLANDAVVQCDEQFEDLFRYAFYETSKDNEKKSPSMYINNTSYYLTGHFVFNIDDHIDDSTKENIRDEFIEEFVQYYKNQ